MNELSKQETYLFSEIRQLIEESRSRVSLAVNSELTVLYWKIGDRINREILNNNRAEYGKQIVVTLSRQLQVDFGGAFSAKNLHRMMQFANIITNEQIVVTLSRQLSWSHIIAIIPIEDELKREFYIQMCINENWSVRTFRERVQSMLFERTAISKQPEVVVKKELEKLGKKEPISPELVFRDPYFLDFLGLSSAFSEKDLESSIVVELQKFITELGSDFAFLARQKRITIDNRDYYIDLLFFHRRLKCLVVIDLKIGEFDAAYKGEMELYLAYMKRYEMVEGENPPIGLILCSGKNPEHVELLQLNDGNIRVSDYLTALPSREILLDRLHRAIAIARNNLQQAESNHA